MPDDTTPRRSQTHRRDVNGAMHVWEVSRLIALAAELPVQQRSMAQFSDDLDEVWWFGGPDHRPTVRAIVDHARRIERADLSVPIILSAEGIVVDAMHRVARAHMEGRTHIDLVQFTADPPPDRIEPMG